MATKEIKKGSQDPNYIKVEFIKEFSGSLNGFKIYVNKLDIKKKNAKRELPIDVYYWIQKFKVCKDA